VQSPAAHPASLGALTCCCRCASQRRRSDRTSGAQLGQRVACPTATQGEWAGAAAAATGVLQLADPRGKGRTRRSAARRPMHTVPRGHDERGSCLSDHFLEFVSFSDTHKLLTNFWTGSAAARRPWHGPTSGANTALPSWTMRARHGRALGFATSAASRS
jgi:hypothetical protein